MFNLPVSDFIRLIAKAKEKHTEEILHQRWCAILPNMNRDNFISFAEYVEKNTVKDADMRPASEILKELEEEDRRKEEMKKNGNGNI